MTGPIDVVKDGVTGALDEDLQRAALRALTLDPEGCRQHALRFGWDVCTREFEGNLVLCRLGRGGLRAPPRAAPRQAAAG